MRGIVITAAAWWGARWLVEPISRFSRAAESLGTSLDSPPIAEDSGPVEVRQTARVLDDARPAAPAVCTNAPLPSPRCRTTCARRSRPDPAAGWSIPDDTDTRRYEPDGQMNTMIDSVLQYLRDEADPEPRQALDLYALAEALVEDLRELGRPATIAAAAR